MAEWLKAYILNQLKMQVILFYWLKNIAMKVQMKLVFLDITASEENREIIKSLVSKVAQVINIPFTVGGGVKTLQHARDILLSGA